MPSIHLVTGNVAAQGLVAEVARALGWSLTLWPDIASVAGIADSVGPAAAAAVLPGGLPGLPPGDGKLVVIDRHSVDQLDAIDSLRERMPHCEIVLFANGPAKGVMAELQRWDIATYFSYPSHDADHLGHVLKGAMDKARLRQEHFHLQENLRHRSLHDDLTGLANGALLTTSMTRIAAQAQGQAGFMYAVMHLDIDRFKNINDSLGHSEGDQLICQVAQRLVAGVRPSDMVARIGGDEFTILLGGVHDVGEAMLIADRVQQSLTEPLVLGSEDIFISASIGVAISRQGDTDPRHLLRDADLAMYRAKAKGAGHIELFDTSMHTRAVELLGLENSLRRALSRNELRLHYQPVVRLKDGLIAGFEALVRWQSPERGLVSPGDFIPLAEETGLIVPMGTWVLREACKQLNAWKQQPGRAHLFMSVNVSARQFSQPRLVEQVAQILQETGVNPADLKLEITESLVIDNVESTVVMLHRLQNMNVRLCVDDFGTGYSSLSQLYQLPIHTLKVDRAFVSRLKDSHSHAEIVDTIIMLAHNLGMDVIAEGIETREQLQALRERNCELGQGYYFARPLAADAAEALLLSLPAWQTA